jgi:catechol 2,3-dioxygenase-like lactoylglutathione lyase family enzyme
MINQLNLVVRDIDAATDFYSRLGVQFADRSPEHRNGRGGAVDFDLDTRSFARVWKQRRRGRVRRGHRLRRRVA